MADGVVGVRQSTSPDRLIDNEVLTVGSETVYRQRVQDPEVIALLEAVRDAVEGTIEASFTGAIALDAPTLAALETITAVVTGTVALDSGTLAALETIELGTATLAALETITATISGAVALDASTLAALESITATISNTVTVTGTVELGSTSLAALESITAVVSGTVDVSNFPAAYPLPTGQVTTLTPQTDALTDTELRASPVEVTFTADESGLTDVQLRATPVPVSGTVTLDAPTLAALETITVLISSGQIVGLDSTTLTALENIVVTGTVALDGPTLAALETINAVCSGTVELGVTTLAALENVTAVVTSVDLDIRPLDLTEDSVRQTHRVMTPLSVSRTGVLTTDVLVAVGPAERIRVLKNSGHCDPEVGDGVYPIVTLKIGSTTIYTDKLESGLPWNEAICFEGALGEDLTLDLSTTSAVYLNIRYELFA